MFKRVINNFIIVFFCIFQCIVLCVSFFAFSSTIEILPWYEPLTMGAAFLLLYLMPFQFFALIGAWYVNRNKILFTKANIILLDG